MNAQQIEFVLLERIPSKGGWSFLGNSPLNCRRWMTNNHEPKASFYDDNWRVSLYQLDSCVGWGKARTRVTWQGWRQDNKWLKHSKCSSPLMEFCSHYIERALARSRHFPCDGIFLLINEVVRASFEPVFAIPPSFQFKVLARLTKLEIEFLPIERRRRRRRSEKWN